MDAGFFAFDKAAFKFMQRGVQMVREQMNLKTTPSEVKKTSPTSVPDDADCVKDSHHRHAHIGKHSHPHGGDAYSAQNQHQQFNR